MVLEGQALSLHSCSVGGKYLYIDIAKIGLIKIRSHRHLLSGAILKQAQIIKKADGWYINLRLVDESIHEFKQILARLSFRSILLHSKVQSRKSWCDS
ncbi:MAG: hypothetical protein AB4038_21060 [Prochloraceae cyanobacterium]